MASLDFTFEIIKNLSNTYADLTIRILNKLRTLLTSKELRTWSAAKLQNFIRTLIQEEISKLHIDRVISKTLIQALQSNLIEWQRELNTGLTQEQLENLITKSRRQLKVAYTEIQSATKVLNATMIKSANRIAGDILTQMTTAKRLGVPINQVMKDSSYLLRNFDFVDKTGRKWNPQSYAEMYIRTTANDLAADVSKNLSNEIDNDLRIIDTQMGSCPQCFNFRDNVISMNVIATKKEIEEITDDGFIYAGTFAQVQQLGFYHPNCRCLLNVYIPTVSTKSTNLSESRNSKNYQDRQKQRALERRVRKYRTQEAGALNKSEQDLAHRKMLDARADLRKFANENNLTRMYWRERLQFTNIPEGTKWTQEFILNRTDYIPKEFIEEIVRI